MRANEKKPHATFISSATGLIHLSDGATRKIGFWLDHEGDVFEGEDLTPDNVRFCVSEPDEVGVMLIDLREAEYGGQPEGRA